MIKTIGITLFLIFCLCKKGEVRMKQSTGVPRTGYHRILKQIELQETSLNELLNRLTEFQSYIQSYEPDIPKSTLNKIKRLTNFAEDIMHEVLSDVTKIQSLSPKYLSEFDNKKALELTRQVDRQEKTLNDISKHFYNLHAIMREHSYRQRKRTTDMQSGKLQNKILLELKRIQHLHFSSNPASNFTEHHGIKLDLDIEKLTKIVLFLSNFSSIIPKGEKKPEDGSSGNFDINLDVETLTTIATFLSNLFNNTQNDNQRIGLLGMLDLNLDKYDYSTIATFLSNFFSNTNEDNNQENNTLGFNFDANSLTTISMILSSLFKNIKDNPKSLEGLLDFKLNAENLSSIAAFLPQLLNKTDKDNQSNQLLNLLDVDHLSDITTFVSTMFNNKNEEKESDGLFNIFNINLDTETLIKVAPLIFDIYSQLKNGDNTPEEELHIIDSQ